MPCYSLEGVVPVVDPSAYVHPSAVLIGDVIVGPDCYVGPCASLRGDFGREVGGGGAEPVGAAAGRLDQPGGRQPRQRHTGMALAHAEQAARRNGFARAQLPAVGGEQQVEDQVARVGRHRAVNITSADGSSQCM